MPDAIPDALDRILREASASPPGSMLAVFDLDSTLFDLRARIEHILVDFAHDPVQQGRYPAACAALLGVRIERRDWGLAEPLGRLGLKESEHAELFADLRSHWAERFFSNDHLHRDMPLPGAGEFVRRLLGLGVDVLYLTGRDVERMLPGTIASLKACQFPLDGERARLRLKPVAGLDDAHFKADVLEREQKTYGRIWFFENEPVNLRVARERLPKIELVLIDTNHSGREQPWPELATIPHFTVDLPAPQSPRK